MPTAWISGKVLQRLSGFAWGASRGRQAVLQALLFVATLPGVRAGETATVSTDAEFRAAVANTAVSKVRARSPGALD